jgi:hypothetical protein
MSKSQRRAPVHAPRERAPTADSARRGPFGDPTLDQALGEAFGPEVSKLDAQTNDASQSYLGAFASTQGSSMSFGPKRDPGRTDDWDAMKTVGEEVSHALAGGGSGQTWLDQPGDPGEASADASGDSFADFMTGGGPAPSLGPALGGRATVHRQTDPGATTPEEKDAPEPEQVEPSVLDNLQTEQLGLIESASDRTQQLASDSAADASGTLKLGGLKDGQNAGGYFEISGGEISAGFEERVGDETVASGFNFNNGELTVGDNMVGPGGAVFEEYGYNNGNIKTPWGSIDPQLSLGIEEQAFQFATNDAGQTSAMLETTSDRTIGADISAKFLSLGFTQQDLAQDQVYFDDMDGRTFEDMQEAREAVFGGDSDAESLEAVLSTFTDGSAGDQFSGTDTSNDSFRLGFSQGVLGVGGQGTDQYLRENSYQNLGEGADGSHLVMISTMEYAAEGAGLEIDAALGSVEGSAANADVMGYSAVVDISTPQGQSDLLLHQTLGFAPQSVQASQLGLAEDASPAEVAERVAEFASLYESGALADNPPDWLDTSDPQWLETLGQMPDFIQDQDADAMRAAGYVSAVQGDSVASKFEATALTASVGTTEYVSSQFEHTFVTGQGDRTLFQTLSENRWSHLFGSGEVGSRSEVEGTEADITMHTNEDGRVEDAVEAGGVQNDEVWHHQQSDDNDGLISDVVLESELTFDLAALEAAGLERENLDETVIDPNLARAFGDYIYEPGGVGLPYEYQGLDGYKPMEGEDRGQHNAEELARMGLTGDEATNTLTANDEVNSRALAVLGFDDPDLSIEEQQAQLDAWAAEHAPPGSSTADFLMSSFGQAHEFVTGETKLGDVEDPVAVVELVVGQAILLDEATALATLPVLHQLDPAQQTEALASILRAAGPDMGADVLAWATANGIDTNATHTAVAQTERFGEIADMRERDRGEGVADFMTEMNELDPALRETLVGDFGAQTVVTEGVTSTNGWAATLAMADDGQMADVMGVLAADPEQQMAVAEAVLANPEEYFSPEMSEEDRRAFIETHIAPIVTQGNPSLLNVDDVLAREDFNRQVTKADWNQGNPDEGTLEATAQYEGMDPQTAKLLTGLDGGDVDLQAVMAALPPGHPLGADLGRFLTQNPDGSPLSADQINERMDQYGIGRENVYGVLEATQASGADPARLTEVFDTLIDDVRDPQQILDMIAWGRANGVELSGSVMDPERATPDTTGMTEDELRAMGADVRDVEQTHGWFNHWEPDTDAMAPSLQAVAGDPEQSKLLIEGYAASITNDDDITNILKATNGDPHLQAVAAQVLMDGGHMTREQVDAWFDP